MMTTNPKRFWQEMTSEEIKEGNVHEWIVVLPIAAIEQHGPHLPLGTDAILGQGYVERVASQCSSQLPVTILPLLSVGKSTEHINFNGTLNLQWDTYTKVLLDLGESLARSGVRKLVIVSSHGGNQSTMETVARELRSNHDMLCVYTGWYKFGLPPNILNDDERQFGIHGGAIETAQMLVFRPDLVRKEMARNFISQQQDWRQKYHHLGLHGMHPSGWMSEDLNQQGVVGNALLATKDMGEAIINHQVSAFLDLLADMNIASTPENNARL